MNQSDDLISVLAEENRELRQLLTELEQLTESESLRRSLADLTIAELVRHMMAEESYLYPVARERLPEGTRIVDRHIAEYGKIEQTLKRLERHDLTSADFSLLLSRLDADARAQLQAEEEEELFPLVARHVGQEELAVLGRKAVESKEKASIRNASGSRTAPC